MIEWTIQNPHLFFILLFFEYAILAINQKRLGRSKSAKPLFILFIIQDWWMNVMMSALFLEFPEKWNELVTGRMERYLQIELNRDDYGLKYLMKAWKYYWGVGLCWLLRRFEKGHCDGSL